MNAFSEMMFAVDRCTRRYWDISSVRVVADRLSEMLSDDDNVQGRHPANKHLVGSKGQLLEVDLGKSAWGDNAVMVSHNMDGTAGPLVARSQRESG